MAKNLIERLKTQLSKAKVHTGKSKQLLEGSCLESSYTQTEITPEEREYSRRLREAHYKSDLKGVGFSDYEIAMLRKAEVEKEAKELSRRGYVGVTLW